MPASRPRTPHSRLRRSCASVDATRSPSPQSRLSTLFSKGVPMLRRLLLTSVAVAGCALVGAPSARAAGDPVKVTGGMVEGALKDGVLSFKGIPFAAPPVGDLRWRAPQPAKPWTGVRAATA